MYPNISGSVNWLKLTGKQLSNLSPKNGCVCWISNQILSNTSGNNFFKKFKTTIRITQCGTITMNNQKNEISSKGYSQENCGINL